MGVQLPRRRVPACCRFSRLKGAGAIPVFHDAHSGGSDLKAGFATGAAEQSEIADVICRTNQKPQWGVLRHQTATGSDSNAAASSARHSASPKPHRMRGDRASVR